MLSKQTVVDQIELTRSGNVNVRVALEIVEDDAVIQRQWHRFSIAEGEDIGGTVEAVNASLAEMKAEPISIDGRARIESAAASIWL